jgi:Fungal specific transcription factor domain
MSSADELDWDMSTPITEQPVSLLSSGPNWSSRSRPRTIDTLPEDMRFYVNYVQQNLRAPHWNFTLDESNFLSHTLIDTALRYDPLLYAVACFGAYHHTVHRVDGKISHFLKYHTASVKSLRESLVAGEKTFATLVTILQLATIEVRIPGHVSGHC